MPALKQAKCVKIDADPRRKTRDIGPSVRVCSFNIEGISPAKSDCMSRILKEYDVDVVLLQETHAKDPQQLSRRGDIVGYSLIAATYHAQYGTAVYARQPIAHTCIVHGNTTSTDNIASTVVQVGEIQLCNIYKPPNSKWPTPALPKLAHPALFIGDFNSHHSNWGYRDIDENGLKITEWAEHANTFLLFDNKSKGTFQSARWGKEYNLDLAFATRDNMASAARAQPVLRDCVAPLERSAGLSADARRPETQLADNADVGNQLHSDANVHTEKQTYVCDICEKRFALKMQLMEHVIIHIHQETDQEEIHVADNTARAPDAREHPALRDCVVRLERLEVVDLEAGRDERLASRAGRDTGIEKEIHGNIDISAEKETYICDTCKKRFPLKSQLVDHVMIHIQRQESGRGVAGNARGGRGEGREPTRAQDWRHACLICRKDFPTPSQLKRHERTHTGERPYSCGICKQKFTQLGNLKRHERIHTGERIFSCGICKQKFTQLGNLKRHELTHTGEEFFSCGICNKKFTQLGDLRRHERSHMGEKLFSCEICKDKFTRLSNLKTHKLTHTGERPFSCGICKKKFTLSGSLKVHERTHTGERPFCCGICNKKFTESGSLKRHERIHS